MWEFLSNNWLLMLVIGGMLVMHLGHGHGHRGHGGHGGCGGHRNSGHQRPDHPRENGQVDGSISSPAQFHGHGPH